MQDGPAVTTNDLPSVKWLTRLLSDESQFAADSPLRGMVIQMCAMLPVDPDGDILVGLRRDTDDGEDLLFVPMWRLLLELLSTAPLRVLVAYTRVHKQWPNPPGAEYLSTHELGVDLRPDGADP